MDASADHLGFGPQPSAELEPFGACPRQIGGEEERSAGDRCAGGGDKKEATAFEMTRRSS